MENLHFTLKFLKNILRAIIAFFVFIDKNIINFDRFNQSQKNVLKIAFIPFTFIVYIVLVGNFLSGHIDERFLHSSEYREYILNLSFSNKVDIYWDNIGVNWHLMLFCIVFLTYIELRLSETKK